MKKHTKEPQHGESPRPLDAGVIADCFESKQGFFIDKDTLLLLREDEAEGLLLAPRVRSSRWEGGSTLGDLITREQVRIWTNLPSGYRVAGNEGATISFLSVAERYVQGRQHLNRTQGVEDVPDLQRQAVEHLLGEIPDWQKRVRQKSVKVLLGPQSKTA